MTDPNTPELWDDIWRAGTIAGEHRANVAREELSIRWRRIEERVRARFGALEDLRVIEIGAGAGTNAAAMAKRGASVTLLDYSPKALRKARELFEANGLQAEFIEANALELPDELRGGFDVAMSFGLNEHFTGAERDGIFQAHIDALRDGGIAIVSVPLGLEPVPPVTPRVETPSPPGFAARLQTPSASPLPRLHRPPTPPSSPVALHPGEESPLVVAARVLGHVF